MIRKNSNYKCIYQQHYLRSLTPKFFFVHLARYTGFEWRPNHKPFEKIHIPFDEIANVRAVRVSNEPYAMDPCDETNHESYHSQFLMRMMGFDLLDDLDDFDFDCQLLDCSSVGVPSSSQGPSVQQQTEEQQEEQRIEIIRKSE